jgi:magnesium chelatase family protein
LHGFPCGHFGDLVHSCSCSSPQIARYLARISGSLLDRIDIQIEVPRLPHDDLLSMVPGESSAAVRERVCAARAIQQARFGAAGGTRRAERGRSGGARKAGAGVFANGAMGARQIRQHCRVGEAAKVLLRAAIQQLGLSARAYDRILKLARTVADLSGIEGIEVEHVAEAIQYRTLDRKLWA